MDMHKPTPFLAPTVFAQKNSTGFFMRINHLHRYDQGVTVVAAARRARSRVVEFRDHAAADDMTSQHD